MTVGYTTSRGLALPTDARERLQVGTYDETIRFNTILVNREIAVVQPYLSTARGVESPTYLVGRPASLNLASRWPLIDQRHLLRRATDQRGRPGTTDP